MSQTISEQMKLKRERQLQRIERANPDHFRFPRHSGPHERGLPFAEQIERHQFRDAAIGAAVFVAFVGALATMPWWLS